jgi:hypothetical protein
VLIVLLFRHFIEARKKFQKRRATVWLGASWIWGTPHRSLGFGQADGKREVIKIADVTFDNYLLTREYSSSDFLSGGGFCVEDDFVVGDRGTPGSRRGWPEFFRPRRRDGIRY